MSVYNNGPAFSQSTISVLMSIDVHDRIGSTAEQDLE